MTCQCPGAEKNLTRACRDQIPRPKWMAMLQTSCRHQWEVTESLAGLYPTTYIINKIPGCGMEDARGGQGDAMVLLRGTGV